MTIHWAGDENRFWRLTDISSIFKLPALQRLALSSAALLDDLIEHLTDLPAAISAVLALPRALRWCRVSNLCYYIYYDPRNREHDMALPEDFREALWQQHQENLKLPIVEWLTNADIWLSYGPIWSSGNGMVVIRKIWIRQLTQIVANWQQSLPIDKLSECPGPDPLSTFHGKLSPIVRDCRELWHCFTVGSQAVD
ncbi:hypothetical protein FB45DRAFT_881863 [Roridomyces roridus]|uniref:Uncharacterized protein n=1 Tax=Roridomyces roridus TaxID=1738132 RepID=A0AAD7AXL0_9AGAR|nr:hypothetical protein FB45DRAFT_881863 [Roridomyces roridus]